MRESERVASAATKVSSIQPSFMQLPFRSILFVLLGVSVLSCDSFGEQSAFADEAHRPPSGFTRTDQDGSIESEDEDDWRTSPLYRGDIAFEPAYPNPARGEVRVTVPFLVTGFNSIQGTLILRAYSEGDRWIQLDEIRAQSGFHTFSFPVSLITSSTSPSLHRLFVLDARGEVVTYGDLKVDLPG